MFTPNVITSRENNTVKYAGKLAANAAFRQSEQSFFAEGLKLCLALDAFLPCHSLFYTQKALEKTPALVEVEAVHYLIEEHVAEKLADARTHQGVFAIFALPSATGDVLRKGGRYLALENVQDPGNVGTLLRSAAAFGFDAVLLSKGCASPFAPKTLRASMGAVAQIPVLEGVALPETLGQLADVGVATLAAALYQSVPLSEVSQQQPDGVCIVIGSEGQGLTDATIAACSRAVRIPMTDKAESLNAGIAGSVLLWHFRGVE
ncbi:MAG: RNA methyltransferase [Faecalibacterium sp.]